MLLIGSAVDDYILAVYPATQPPPLAGPALYSRTKNPRLHYIVGNKMAAVLKIP